MQGPWSRLDGRQIVGDIDGPEKVVGDWNSVINNIDVDLHRE